jgi:FkbM family methyltransferase
MPTSRVRQLLKFIQVFGITGGIRLWCSLLLQLSLRSGSLELRIPGMAAPIRLRRQDLPIFWQIMVMRENDFQSLPQASRVKDVYSGFLSEGNKPVIVDCGGHVGLSAVWFASHFPDAIVYSIEPDLSNFRLLQQNTEAYTNVIALRGGVWNRCCHLEISNPLSGSASFRLQEVSELVSPEQPDLLRGYTIDEIFRQEKANRLFLVKIDIEGAEAEVFQGPTEWLESATMLIIELHDWLLPGQGTSRNFFKRVAENNFDVVLRGENLLLFQVPDLNKTSEQSFPARMLVTEP